jgi:hypothetical protein
MTDLPLLILLPLLFVVAFVQNMAFTAVSRSRNGGDVPHQFRVAIVSNGVWFVTQFLILGSLMQALTTGSFWKLAVVGVVYVAATSLGSAYMMAKLLKSETGKRRVGAY